MHLIHNQQSIPQAFKHAIVSIGNFDGVHLGHQQLLKSLKARSQELGCACGIILFEPQPQEFFLEQPPARLSTLRQKYQLLKQQGIDFILVLRFNKHLAQLAAKDFITQVLWQQLHIQEIWVGKDFRFGHQRLGDINLLNEQGQQLGFKVHIMPDVKIGESRISSTLVRNLLAVGDLQEARQLLGRFFSIEGRVIAGDARGRLLNMRTANIRPQHKTIPLQGIFVVRVACAHQEWPAVASLGTRPVFSGQILLLEVHIFNFNKDIYHERINVELLHKLRDEQKFDSVDSLQAQMQQDLIDAKNYWEQHYDEL